MVISCEVAACNTQQEWHSRLPVSERVCELLADFSAADERLRLDSGFVRLKRAAEELRQTAQSVVGQSVSSMQARILLDRDHQYAIAALCSGAS
jgi:hypothetical protein